MRGDPVRSGVSVENADRPDGKPLGAAQQGAGVKAQPIAGGYEGIEGEPEITARIGPYQEVILQNGVGARGVQRKFARAYPALGLEPLTVSGEQIHEGDGRAECFGARRTISSNS